MSIKSITIDFEHERVTVRHFDAAESYTSVNKLSPKLFDAIYESTTVPDDVVDAELGRREEKIKETNADPKAAAQIRSPESVARVAENMRLARAKEATAAAAKAVVDGLLEHFRAAYDAKKDVML